MTILELAIAETYRPRQRKKPPATAHQVPPSTALRRSATFATNPSARAAMSPSSPQPPSAPSRSFSVSSRSRSFVNFFARRRRGNSISSSAAVAPQDAERADLLLSQATVTPATHTVSECTKVDEEPPNLDQVVVTASTHISSPSTRRTRALPTLPPPVPLPPQEDLIHFDTALQSAIEGIQASRPSQGLDLTLTILEHMSHISDLASCIAISWPEFYALLLHATQLIISVLPASESSARNALVRCLARLVRRWPAKWWNTTEIARVAGQVFDSAVYGRRMSDSQLGSEFARWLNEKYVGHKGNDMRLVRILTLGVSGVVLAGLQYALAEDANLEIHLSVLTALDHGLPPLPSYEGLHITTYPASAIGTASQDMDILLLEPSYIDPDGSLGCKNGALGTAVCVKTLSSSAKIVSLSGADNIAISVAKERIPGENGVGGEISERIPSKFVDVYIADSGALDVGDLQELAAKAEQLDQHILTTEGD